MPALPDEVKLDLAGNTTMTPQALGFFLGGVDDAVRESQRRQPLPTRDPAFLEPIGSQYDRGTELARLIYGTSGTGRVETFDAQAVSGWKQRAVDKGYLALTPEQVADQRWLPEYSKVAGQMLRDQMSEEFSGNKPGSLSVNQVFDIVEDWLSPKALYQAALELDFWWDMGAIDREIGSWGDKFRAWGDEPWNPRRAIDALTGPLDDILLPVVNWGLLLVGFSQVRVGVLGAFKGAQAVEKGFFGARAIAGMKAAPGGQYVAKFLEAADAGADLEHFRKSSLMSVALGSRGGTPGTAFGRGIESARATPLVKGAHTSMQRWRDMGGVVAAKKINQQALRLGFTSNLESLIDDEQGGASLAAVTGIDEAVASVMSNPAAQWSVDLLIYPPNIFERGALSFAVKGAGRAAAAVTGFKELTDNQHLTMAFHNAVRNRMQETAPELVARFDQEVADHGVGQALANLHTGGDLEAFGAQMEVMVVGALIDEQAAYGLARSTTDSLTAKDKRLYLRSKDHLQHQMTHYDEADVEFVIGRFAEYGDTVGAVEKARKPGAKYRRLEKMRDSYRSEVGSGVVADGDVRLYGTMNSEGSLSWSTDRGKVIDPYFVDVNLNEFGATVDEVAADAAAYADRVRTRHRIGPSPEGYRYTRVSDAETFRRYDPEKLEGLRGLIRDHNQYRAKYSAELLAGLNPATVEQYVYENFHTLGDWSQYLSASEEIRAAASSGLLDEARFVDVLNPDGQRVGIGGAVATGDEKFSREMEDLFHAMRRDPDLRKNLSQSSFAPLSREVDPATPRFTAARSDSVTKQEALTFHTAARSVLQKAKVLQRMRNTSSFQRAVTRIDEGIEAGEKAKAIAADLHTNFGVIGVKEKDFRRLVREAARDGVSIDDMIAAVDRQVEELIGSDLWAGRFNVPSLTGSEHLGVDSLKVLEVRLKELYAQSGMMASELTNVPKQLAEQLERSGYKLVHGVDFNQPQDLMGILPGVEDVTRKQMSRQRFRSWWGRQEPEYVATLKNRVIRSSLSAELAKAKTQGRDIRLVVDGDGATDVEHLLTDLYEILDETQTSRMAELVASQDRGVVSRTGTRISHSRAPMSLERLPRDIGSFELFRKTVMGRGYTQDETFAIYRALQASQKMGFQNHGLYAIESTLRSRPNVTGTLRLLGKHEAVDGLVSVRGLTTRGAKLVAPITGAALVGNEYAEDHGGFNPTDPLQIGAGVLGFAAGRAGSTALMRHTGAVVEGAGRAGQMANALENSKFLKYTYLADGLANLRDQVRFSLSPIFDASRYSEAIILSQMAELPEGMRNLRLAQSPSATRKRFAAAARAAGHDKDTAANMALREFQEFREEFGKAARGDFQLETIDGVARRFSSVGIMGFSPAEWMTAMFANLRKEGVEVKKAYEIVRDIHTYGTTGRSAAEMSMNFVFFPFSFTKKTLTHMTKFVQQDMGRLIIAHDMLKTYELLSDRYDLSNEFRDRLPIINRMNRMNVLAYGFGLGRFGGVNAPMLGALREMPVLGDVYVGPEMDSIAGLFVPNMVRMSSQDDGNEVWELLQQALPAMNDVTSLLDDAMSQGYVVAARSHVTREAESRRGWQEWREFQDSIIPALREKGWSWSQAMNRPEFNDLVKQKRADIGTLYPSWEDSMAEGAAHSQALVLEKERRLRNPEGPEDFLLATYQSEYVAVGSALSQVGLSFDNIEEVPGEVSLVMRKRAIELARQDPRFKRLYDRFYRRTFGDISLEMT